MPLVIDLVSRSAEETQRLAQALGKRAWPGAVFLLIGELGSGKTCFIQGLARGLGVTDYVSSPSFVILRVYRGRLPLYHLDFYRMAGVEEIADLGLEDYLGGEGVVAVEWADRGMPLFPQEHLLVELDFVDEAGRRLRLCPRGRRYEELASAVAVGLAPG